MPKLNLKLLRPDDADVEIMEDGGRLFDAVADELVGENIGEIYRIDLIVYAEGGQDETK